MLAKILRYLRNSIRHLEVVLVTACLSFCLLLFPFQKHMPLSRFQHYSFVIIGCAIGFLLQSVRSWPHISWWGRLALLGSATYLTVFGSVFLLNPWIDFNASMNTELQLEFRQQLAAMFMIAGLPLTFLWSRWSMEKNRTRKLEKTAEVNKIGQELGQ